MVAQIPVWLAGAVAAATGSISRDDEYAGLDAEQRSALFRWGRVLRGGQLTEPPAGCGLTALPVEHRGHAYALITPSTDLGGVLAVVPLHPEGQHVGLVSDCMIQVPHPKADQHSEILGQQLWDAACESGLRTTLVVSGTHRHSGDGANADAAHNRRHSFAILTRALSHPRLPQLQVHGFADKSLPGVSAVVSSSRGFVSSQLVGTARRLGDTGLTVARSWAGADQLTGMTNQQGRYAAQQGLRFCHLELSATTRAHHTDVLIDAVIGAGLLDPEPPAPTSPDTQR